VAGDGLCAREVPVVEVKWRIDGDAAFAIEQLVPQLDEEGGRQCHAAVRALVHMGDDAKNAMPALVAALKRYKDHNVLWAVGELAPHAQELALPALRAAMTEPSLADDAAIALQSLGEPAEQLIPRRWQRCARWPRQRAKERAYAHCQHERIAADCCSVRRIRLCRLILAHWHADC